MKILEIAEITPSLSEQLIIVWEKSVKATHLFYRTSVPFTNFIHFSPTLFYVLSNPASSWKQNPKTALSD